MRSLPSLIALVLQGTLAAQQFSGPTSTPIPATYRVVLKDGAQYVTREPYRPKGRSAVFTFPSGQLVSIPLEKIDQEATRKANLRLHRPPPATVPVKRTPVRIVLIGTPAPTLLPSKTADDSFVGHLSFSGQGHVTLFDSTGTALEDVAVAVAVYEKALAAGRGPRFAFGGP